MTLTFIEGLGFHASITEWVGCISQGAWEFEGLLCENIVNVVDHLRTISHKLNDILNQRTTKASNNILSLGEKIFGTKILWKFFSWLCLISTTWGN
jgi:hypothetical protein